MAKGFRIAARALRQLGAELITSDAIALNELIKNSFDARSPRVSIEIYSPIDVSGALSLSEKLLQNSVTVLETLSEMGRLVSDSLSDTDKENLLKQLKPSSDSPTKLATAIKQLVNHNSWIKVQDKGSGMTADDLQDAFLVVGTPRKWLEKQKKSANSLPILGDKGVGRLSMMRLGRYAYVESTCENEAYWHGISFDWEKFDDPNVYLDDVEVIVNKNAKPKTAITEHGTTIHISGLNSSWTKSKVIVFINNFLRRLQHPLQKNIRRFPVDVYFNGERQAIPGMHDWFQKCANFRAIFSFNPSGNNSEDVILRRTLRWRESNSDDIREWEAKEFLEQLNLPRSTLKRLGSFEVDCLWFNRQQIAPKSIEVNPKQVKAELDLWCGGFAIYRDGFRVGMTGGLEDDWLEMDKGSLRAKGFALNRYQTVGTITLNSKENPLLTDAANRERLIGCPEYDALKAVLGVVAVKDLRMHINVIKEAEAKAAISEETTEEALKRSEQQLTETVKTIKKLEKVVPPEVRATLGEVNQSLRSHLEDIRRLERAVELAKETRTEILELAGIGLVVEIVIHELARMTSRTLELLSGLQGDKNNEVSQLVETLKQQIKATNKRIRTVDALSPSGRHRKGEFDLVAFTKSVLAGYATRFERHRIQATVCLDGEPAKNPFKVNLVMGLIAQVLENLLTNSVYWLKQGLSIGQRERKIFIDIEPASMTMSIKDNGPGIDPRYGKQIFNPYFTTRHRGKGLGLFIASEIASYHGAKLYLDETPDEDGRLRCFILEIPRS